MTARKTNSFLFMINSQNLTPPSLTELIGRISPTSPDLRMGTESGYDPGGLDANDNS